jgi:putative transposase
MQRGVSFALKKNQCMTQLQRWAGAQRFIWNAKRSESEYFYNFGSKFVPMTQWQGSKTNPNPEFNLVDQQYSQFKSRELTPWLFDVPSQVLRNAATEWFQTQWKFMRGECGAPSKKHRDDGDSLYLTKELFRFDRDKHDNIKLWIGTSKFPVGYLNVNWHTKNFQLPNSIRIKISKFGQWKVSFSYDDGLGDDVNLEVAQKAWLKALREKSKAEILELTEGIDRGVTIPLATTTASFAMTAAEKKRLHEHEVRRKRWQRQLARQQIGSKRRNLVEKTSATVFVLENLAVRNMTKSAKGTIAGFPRFVPLDFLNTVPLLNA